MKTTAFAFSLLLFSLIILLPSCKKEGEKPPPYYFKGTIDGQKIQWTIPYGVQESTNKLHFAVLNSTYGGMMYPFIGCTGDQISRQESEGTTFSESIGNESTGANSIDVSFVNSYEHEPTGEEIRSWFTPGAKPFGFNREKCSDPVVPGFVIFFTDANGKWWVSSKGDQSTGVFESLSVTDPIGNVFYRKDWTARFSCKLYDESGNYITCSDCEIRGPVFSL